MKVQELISKYDILGVQLWLENGQLNYKAPPEVLNETRIAELRAHKEALIEYIKACETASVTPDWNNEHASFPLTDIQSAYLIGRGKEYELGGVGCHAYFELTLPVIDIKRMEKAWHKLIRRHGMLRAVINPEGYQQVLTNVEIRPLLYQHLTSVDNAEIQNCIERIRKEFSSRIYSPGKWPLYELRATITDNYSILHLSIDMLVADSLSIQRILMELWQLYHNPATPLPELEISFRDVVLFARRRADISSIAIRKQQDQEYWIGRIPKMPGPATLPVQTKPTNNDAVEFERHSITLSQDKWTQFCVRARQKKITPSCAVLSAYAEIIARWANSCDFCLSITVLDREEIHDQINLIVGDFSSTNILEVRLDYEKTFLMRTLEIQNRLWEDLDHKRFSGVEVLREMNRRSSTGTILIPLVFTSTIGLMSNEDISGDGGFLRDVGISYGLTQTPQVWIDCQASDWSGQLKINWDVRKGIFPDGLIKNMFSAFKKLLNDLVEDDAIYQNRFVVPSEQRTEFGRIPAGHADQRLSGGVLHQKFWDTVAKSPDDLAIVTGDNNRVTYGQLAAKARMVYQALLDKGAQEGHVVAIRTDSEIEHVACVLGILSAGCTFVTIESTWSDSRRDSVFKTSSIKFVVYGSLITEKIEIDSVVDIELGGLNPNNSTALPSMDAHPDLPAVILYTSGKANGVVVSHASASNTIFAVNKKFNISPKDSLLTLARLSDDVFIYEMFAMFAVGGALVFPNRNETLGMTGVKSCLMKHKITILSLSWANICLLLSGDEPITHQTSLPTPRLILCSKGRAKLNALKALLGHYPSATLAVLGGWIESGTWNSMNIIDPAHENIPSIALGIPFENQLFYVLDNAGKNCPYWTIGDLYIGGNTLASGFTGEAGSREPFIHHAEVKVSLFDTGCLARVRPDGVYELLGYREDVPFINGKFVDLVEIENQIESHPAVFFSVVLCSESETEYKLTAFVEPRKRDSAVVGLSTEDLLLNKVCISAGEKAIHSIDIPLFQRFMGIIDEMTILDMIGTFQNAGLFQETGQEYTISYIHEAMHVVPKYHYLMRRWLRALCQEDILQVCQAESNDATYSLSKTVEKDRADFLWAELEIINKTMDYGTEILDFHRDCREHLTELLNGEANILNFFFPEGRLERAISAYGDNLVSRYLNQVIIEGVVTLVQAHHEQGKRQPIKILEIGGGVAGLTRTLAPILAGLKISVDYLFTDVSQFFLNEARSRFKSYPWIRYGLFDINKPYWEQGLTAFSYDIILSSNVLHNAVHCPSVLSSIKELMSSQGAFLVVDAMERNTLLTSFEFEEGLTDFKDIRAEKGKRLRNPFYKPVARHEKMSHL